MTAFENSSYRAQVLRLRELAEVALRQFPIKVKALALINHGENATFRVTAASGAEFLLRIHRREYHSKPALFEELQWLGKLSNAGLQVPQVVRSKKGDTLVAAETLGAGLRYCDMFHWIDGRFLSKSISEDDMYEIGVLLAKVQSVGKKVRCRHRRYWTSDGLVGATPKFGSIDTLDGVGKAEQKKITSLRKKTFSRLKAYERSHPTKMGMIHADLHFRNLLKTTGGPIAAIDFDDCGYGFFIYDLVIPLVGLEYHLRDHKRFRLYPRFKKALLAGYASRVELSAQDLVILQDLIIARKLLMLGWLQSRQDNPRLRGRVKKAARYALKYAAKPTL